MGDLEQFEDLLLRSARNGDTKTLKEILQARQDGKVNLDISCKGKTKINQGWTPLHLASYFGHRDCAEALLQHGAAIDELNDAGDTPLHKAALTNREDVVLLLLEHGGSVSIINGEGLRPSDLPRDLQVKKLIIAAEKTEQRRKEERLLHYAREGKSEEVMKLLKEPAAPNVNCADPQGNTSLHCAAYRGHIDVAVVLLQNGCDPAIKNLNGQTAYELAQTQQMQQVLEVQPVRSFHRSVTRFEGPLLRKMRIISWRMVWAVLERGVLTFFNSRADASSGVRRRDYKYLDNCKIITTHGGDGAIFIIQYNDGTCHRLAATPDPVHSAAVNRQKWVAALANHIRFSTHYVQNGLAIDDDDDDDDLVDKTFKPLGCMNDAVETATAHQQLLQQQVEEVIATMASLDLDHSQHGGVHDVLKRFSSLAGTARNMTNSLTHCLSLMKQQEEVRELQLKEEREKVRVLEESLRVLATEHHELEESIASHVSSNGSSIYNTPANSYVSLPRPRRFFDAVSEDEFFDAFSQDDDGSGGTLVSLPSPCGSECSTNTLVSCMSSLPTDPQSPQSPSSHILSGHPCAPSNTPVPHATLAAEGTYTVLPSSLEVTGGHHVGSGGTYTVSCSDAILDSALSVTESQNADSGHTMTTTISGLMNTVSGLFTGSMHTTISSSVMNSSSVPCVTSNLSAPLSASSTSQSSHLLSSMTPEPPLVKTSDLSDHSDGSDDTVTSDSRRGSEVEEK